jgi:septum formation protein
LTITDAPTSSPKASGFATPQLWLASQSPRRAQLLTQLGVPHRVQLPDDALAAEALEAVQPGEAPRDYVQRVTLAKLGAASQSSWNLQATPAGGEAGAPILCADTTVALGQQILGKPADDADAARMLRALQGRSHEVFTAVAVGWRGQQLAALSRSVVEFAPMGEADIARYVASGEPRGKAGAYGIQGLAAQHVQQISGSYTGIMGLPLFETAQLLKQIGWWR